MIYTKFGYGSKKKSLVKNTQVSRKNKLTARPSILVIVHPNYFKVKVCFFNKGKSTSYTYKMWFYTAVE